MRLFQEQKQAEEERIKFMQEAERKRVNSLKPISTQTPHETATQTQGGNISRLSNPSPKKMLSKRPSYARNLN
jgi:hypothetical protein